MNAERDDGNEAERKPWIPLDDFRRPVPLEAVSDEEAMGSAPVAVGIRGAMLAFNVL